MGEKVLILVKIEYIGQAASSYQGDMVLIKQEKRTWAWYFSELSKKNV